jgi:hypothetical protein
MPPLPIPPDEPGLELPSFPAAPKVPFAPFPPLETCVTARQTPELSNRTNEAAAVAQQLENRGRLFQMFIHPFQNGFRGQI